MIQNLLKMQNRVRLYLSTCGKSPWHPTFLHLSSEPETLESQLCPPNQAPEKNLGSESVYVLTQQYSLRGPWSNHDWTSLGERHHPSAQQSSYNTNQNSPSNQNQYIVTQAWHTDS